MNTAAKIERKRCSRRMGRALACKRMLILPGGELHFGQPPIFKENLICVKVMDLKLQLLLELCILFLGKVLLYLLLYRYLWRFLSLLKRVCTCHWSTLLANTLDQCKKIPPVVFFVVQKHFPMNLYDSIVEVVDVCLSLYRFSRFVCDFVVVWTVVCYRITWCELVLRMGRKWGVYILLPTTRMQRALWYIPGYPKCVRKALLIVDPLIFIRWYHFLRWMANAKLR